jgi:mono/diheme cytochrome c family protein
MRPIHALPVVLAVATLAGCGGGSGGTTTTDPATAPAPSTQSSTATRTGTSTTTPAKPSGPDGAKVFASAGCASCHTLKAANATGGVGPNLDDLKPSSEAVKAQVTNGGGGMPSFGGSLSSAEIDAVARYVSASAGR